MVKSAEEIKSIGETVKSTANYLQKEEALSLHQSSVK